MITYTILKQGVGVIDSLMPEEIKDNLLVKIRDAEGNVVKLIGEDHVAYATVHNNLATFERSDIKGNINLSLVRSSGVVPLGSFICVPHGDSIMLYQNEEQLLSRLARVEREISNLLDMQHRIEAKYDDLISRIERLFAGYNI